MLSWIVDLRRSSPLFFIPLVPYPARSARHLPHAGKAVILKYRFPPSNLRPFGAPPSIGRRECPREPLPLEGAAERSEAGLAFFFGRRSRLLFAFPIGEGGPRQRRSGAFANDVLETISPLSFIPLVPYPARSARHLPHTGKAFKLSGRTFLAPHRGSSPKGRGGYVAVLHESVEISIVSDYST